MKKIISFCLFSLVVSTTLVVCAQRKREVKYKLAIGSQQVQITFEGPSLPNLLGQGGSSTQELKRELNARSDLGERKVPGLAVATVTDSSIIINASDVVKERPEAGSGRYGDFVTFAEVVWMPIIQKHMSHVKLVLADGPPKELAAATAIKDQP